jgi:hypothetical protein
MDYDNKKKDEYDDPDIVVADAKPIEGGSNEPPIPPGHSRFYCSKCHTVGYYPNRDTVQQAISNQESWR